MARWRAPPESLWALMANSNDPQSPPQFQASRCVLTRRSSRYLRIDGNVETYEPPAPAEPEASDFRDLHAGFDRTRLGCRCRFPSTDVLEEIVRSATRLRPENRTPAGTARGRPRSRNAFRDGRRRRRPPARPVARRKSATEEAVRSPSRPPGCHSASLAYRRGRPRRSTFRGTARAESSRPDQASRSSRIRDPSARTPHPCHTPS